MYLFDGIIMPVIILGIAALTLVRLNQRLRAAEFELSGLREIVLALRARLEAGAPVRAEAPVGETPPVQDAVAEEPDDAGIDAQGPWQTASAATAAMPEAATEPAIETDVPPAPAGAGIETALGTRWAVWVGGLALALGGAFLVRYTIESGLLGPMARLVLGALFGLALVAGGEFARRTGYTIKAAGSGSAYLPGVLVAVGSFTLFGVVYAAHAIYGFIGPAMAFGLLAIIALLTIGAALIHGQAMAGVGLLGAYATPLLVASNAPNAWALFIEIAVALAGAAAIAAMRRWLPLMLAATIGAGLWLLVYLVDGAPDGISAPAFMGMAIVAVVTGVWMRSTGEGAPTPARLFDPVGIAMALPVGLAALAMASDADLLAIGGAKGAALVVVALMAGAIWRQGALAALPAALLATLGFAIRATVGDGSSLIMLLRGPDTQLQFLETVSRSDFLWFALPVGAVALSAGLWSARRLAGSEPLRSGVLALTAGLAPALLLAASWLGFGHPDIDPMHAALLLVLAVLLAGFGEWIGRELHTHSGLAVAGAWTTAALALVAAIHAGAGPALTTMLIAGAAAAVAFAWTFRPAPIITWIAAGLAAIFLGRVLYDPTLVGAASLGKTPVFNYLLAGYGLPVLAFAAAAWRLRGEPRQSPVLLMQALSAGTLVLAIAMLVRHATNGGVIDGREPQLSELAVDSLAVIGLGAVLVALDRRAASPVFRHGSILLGILALAGLLFGHLIALNPLRTNASTGSIMVFNQLFLAYLMPGVALGLLALFSRPYRPLWWVRALTAGGAVLLFAYATLSLRRLFKGEFIGAWKGLEPLETWSYSALWLALGVLLLVLGLRFNSLVLRFGSALLVVLAVAKVFIFDMAELEGALRAFSFIALGAVLIGIGLFYQRMLMRKAA